MELIGKISKGSKMDQIYLPKNRESLATGSYVLIKPLETIKQQIKPYFYNIKSIEPIKLQLINQILGIIDNYIKNENILISGSILDKGFNFNDIDVIIVAEEEVNGKKIKLLIEQKIKIKTHILIFDNKTLSKGLATDPLYQLICSRVVSKKRFIYPIKQEINYKILDLHLLKSKLLINSFDILNGNEKYQLVRNLVAIYLFLENKKITQESVSREIKKQLADPGKIKQNLLDKNFLKKYKALYDKTFQKILKGIENAPKQEKTN